jgi:hypothetical protein
MVNFPPNSRRVKSCERPCQMAVELSTTGNFRRSSVARQKVDLNFDDRRPERATFDAYCRKFEPVKNLGVRSLATPSSCRDRHRSLYFWMLVVQADRHGYGELVLALWIEKMLRQLCAIATTPLPDGTLDLVAMCHASGSLGSLWPGWVWRSHHMSRSSGLILSRNGATETNFRVTPKNL